MFLLLNLASSMYGVNRNNTTDLSNYTFSPVTFNEEWPKVWRLVIMVTMATLGTTLNGFFVASFFVERPLRRAGLVYLACIGLTDMIITGVILPVSSVVLLSGDWDNVRVCNVVQCLGMSAVYCYSLFFMFTAIEEYLRVCCSKQVYGIVTRCNVAITTITVFILSFTLGSVGVYLDLDYDYCERLHYGNIYYRAVSVVMLHLIPCLFTFYYLFAAHLSVCRRAATQPSYRRSHAYSRDKSITVLNLTTYATFFLAWVPYVIISFNLGAASDDTYYNSIWFGHGRAVLATSMYSIMDRGFRRAFAHLFNYCCCKSSLSGQLAPRHRREYCTRVRLLQPNMFMARSAQIRLAGRARAVSLIRETQHL
ncbi:kappa-type opioid receptor-like isoform X1 [Pieris brassicae]|uniref:kappa-type opioid receptor-like isoform X1 n=1 Tax=Pieris brassicae TaxID=7116 RepID=UPI001E6614AC|nr:kappa-type opioid receptor-like isoform X1 [Pieris brassicae]